MHGPDGFKLREHRAARARQAQARAQAEAQDGGDKELKEAGEVIICDGVHPDDIKRPPQDQADRGDGVQRPPQRQAAESLQRPPQRQSAEPSQGAASATRRPPPSLRPRAEETPFARQREASQSSAPTVADAKQGSKPRTPVDPTAGWVKDGASASAAPRDAKKHNATEVLASGFRKTHKQPATVEEADAPSGAEQKAPSSRRVTFGDDVGDGCSAAPEAAADEDDGSKKREKHRKSRLGETREERKLRHEKRRLEKENEAMEQLKKSSQMAKLRKMVRGDTNALQHFLEALTETNPELMRVIAGRRDEFMAMVLEEEQPESKLTTEALALEEQASTIDPPDQATEGDDAVSVVTDATELDPQAKARKARRQRQRIEKAFQPTTTNPHPLALLHSPYTCAICKTTKNLMLCSACKSVRFCCREHQRQFWPRHQTVCKFLAGCQGGLLAEVSGKHWTTEALPKILHVWTQATGKGPENFEYEQLCHMPRCHKCRKVPATVVCDRSHFVGYCSEACRSADREWAESWQCQQVMLTAICAVTMHQAGGGLYPKIGGPDVLPASVFENGWSEYVTFAEVKDQENGTEFLKCNPIVQQVLIDHLSYPMTVLEGLFLAGRSIEKLCEGRDVLEVHLLMPDQGALADMYKFGEWLQRAGPHVKALNIRVVGSQVLGRSDGGHKKNDYTKGLQENALLRGCKMYVHFYDTLCVEWLDKVAASFQRRTAPLDSNAGGAIDSDAKVYDDILAPTFRVAFSPGFNDWPSGDEMDVWGPVLHRLAGLQDCVPLVVTEKLMKDMSSNDLRAKKYGLTTLVEPVASLFSSPLALVDDTSSKEDNPFGLLIFNMATAVFEAAERVEPVSKSEIHEMVAGMAEPFKICEEDELEDEEGQQIARTQEGTSRNVNGNKPFSVETRQQAPVHGDAVFELAGPFTFDGSTFNDIAHDPTINPDGAFSVQFDVRCESGGRGYRSPLSSRDDPPAGYVFYVDADDCWTFWVGDGRTKYWAGIQGPATCMNAWTQLMGVIDPCLSEIRFYVDGELAGTRSGVTFSGNTQRPLRLGAGRSERPLPLFWFAGQVRDIVVRTWAADNPMPQPRSEE